jgi:hypothetical protein
VLLDPLAPTRAASQLLGPCTHRSRPIATTQRCPLCPESGQSRHTSRYVRFVPIATERSAAKNYSVTSSSRPIVRVFAERTLRNILPGSPDHSGLMLAARITLAHLSI